MCAGLCIALFVFLLFAPNVVLAQEWLNTALGSFFGMIINVLGKLLGLEVRLVIAVGQYNGFMDSGAVTKGWVILRDVFNMFFIVILLVISFATVLGWQEYHYSKTLPALLTAAVMVNFSKAIAGLLIDFGQVVMLTFMSALKDAGEGNMAALLGIKDMVETANGPATAQSTGNLLGSLILAIVLLVIAVIVVGVMLSIIVARIVSLWLLVAMSPIAFVGTILPFTRRFATDWWSKFSTTVMVGPFIAFFLWLALAVVADAGDKGIGGTMKMGGAESKLQEGGVTVGPGTSGTPAYMLNFIIGIALLLGGLQMSISMASQMGGAAGTLVKKTEDFMKAKKLRKDFSKRREEAKRAAGKEGNIFSRARGRAIDFSAEKWVKGASVAGKYLNLKNLYKKVQGKEDIYKDKTRMELAADQLTTSRKEKEIELLANLKFKNLDTKGLQERLSKTRAGSDESLAMIKILAGRKGGLKLKDEKDDEGKEIKGGEIMNKHIDALKKIGLLDTEQGIDTLGISKQFASLAYKLNNPEERGRLANRINSGQVDMNSLSAKDRADLIPDIAKSRDMTKEKFDTFLKEVYRDIKPEDKKDFFNNFKVDETTFKADATGKGLGNDHRALAAEFLAINTGKFDTLRANGIDDKGISAFFKEYTIDRTNLNNKDYIENMMKAFTHTTEDTPDMTTNRSAMLKDFADANPNISNQMKDASLANKDLVREGFNKIAYDDKTPAGLQDFAKSIAGNLIIDINRGVDQKTALEKNFKNDAEFGSYISKNPDQAQHLSEESAERFAHAIVSGLGDRFDRDYKRLPPAIQDAVAKGLNKMEQFSDHMKNQTTVLQAHKLVLQKELEVIKNKKIQEAKEKKPDLSDGEAEAVAKKSDEYQYKQSEIASNEQQQQELDNKKYSVDLIVNSVKTTKKPLMLSQALDKGNITYADLGKHLKDPRIFADIEIQGIENIVLEKPENLKEFVGGLVDNPRILERILNEPKLGISPSLRIAIRDVVPEVAKGKTESIIVMDKERAKEDIDAAKKELLDIQEKYTLEQSNALDPQIDLLTKRIEKAKKTIDETEEAEKNINKEVEKRYGAQLKSTQKRKKETKEQPPPKASGGERSENK
ncbi:MAG: hypothetical protein HYW78_04145 [Parcubacteria group bacterium]|nr:hypothetical protein [Parcubacteria group bacterium]